MKKNIILILLGTALGVAVLSVSHFVKNSSDETSFESNMYEKQERDIEDGTLTSEEAYKLSEAYLHEIREKGMVKNYEKLERLIAYLESRDEDASMLNALKSSVASGKHDFKEAYGYIQEAISEGSERAKYYGIKGDIELELGKYSEAVDSYQKMVNIRPDFHSYTRIAYVRELYGDVEGALDSYELAIESGAPRSENIAWAYNEKAKLYMRSDLEQAKLMFEKALTMHPDYAPAVAGISEVAFYEGDIDEAIRLAQRAFDILPTAEYATLLGDLHTVDGDTKQAEKYYALAEIATHEAEDDDININLEYAEFLGLRGLKLSEATERALQAYEERPSVKAHDVHMWLLFKSGERKKALEVFRAVMADETLEAIASANPAFLFHGGVMMAEEGKAKEGQALIQKAIRLHPRFSLVESQQIELYADSAISQ